MRHPAQLVIFVALTAMTACVSAPTVSPVSVEPVAGESIAAHVERAERRRRVRHQAFASRPSILSSFELPYRELPLVGPLRPPRRKPGISIDRSNHLAVSVDHDLVAEIVAGGCRWFAAPKSSSSLASPELAQIQERGPIALMAGCDASQASAPKAPPVVSFFGCRLATWSDDRIDCVVSETVMRGSSRAVAAATVEARALLPRVLYAFRRCTHACNDAGAPEREEELVLVGPGARWIVSSVSPEMQRRAGGGALTLASIPLRRGGSGSALLHVGWRELAYWVGLGGPAPAWATEDEVAAKGEIVQLSVEAAWPADADEPQGIGFVSKVTLMTDRLLDLHAAQ